MKIKQFNNKNINNLLELLIETKNWIYQEQRFTVKLKNIVNTNVKKLTKPSNDKFATLKKEVEFCQKCQLFKTRKQIVFGNGKADSHLMIIGEAPGHDEDIQGLPFVGQAGELLTKMLKAINIDRNDVYIANVIKCRPPKNRNPIDEEISNCSPFLHKQIDIINPKVIVTLGNFATQFLLKKDMGISKLRGKTYQFQNKIILPTYHPSALLHNPSLKRAAWYDLKLLKLLLHKK